MIDPISEAEYRLRLANEHLGRAEAYYGHGDWAGCVHYSQLAIEKVPTWSHDPSNQLMNVMNRVPEGLRGLVGELARLSHEAAREYARSTYGEPSSLLTPGMLYDRDYAGSMLNSTRRAGILPIPYLGNWGSAFNSALSLHYGACELSSAYQLPRS